MKRRILTAVLAGCMLSPAIAADWPTYRGDSERSGFTAEELPGTLRMNWSFQSRHAPAPAWPRSKRMKFDRSFQPVCAGGRVFFGSSADGRITALDLATGQVVWEHFTGGPVRFAPAVWKDTVFVCSDDGFLHALATADGVEKWKFRAAPSGELVLGNGRMISKWPVRGGVVVRDGTVYLGAGIWPSEGIFLCALDAASGELKWKSANSGSLAMRQPHGAMARSGVSAQGYLVAGERMLLVATGRGVPACFDRATGEFRYFHLNQYGKSGGGESIIVGDMMVSGAGLFELKSGRQTDRYPVDEMLPGMVSGPEGVVVTRGERVIGYRLADKRRRNRQGVESTYRGLEEAWSVRIGMPADCLIQAGDRILCGGPGRIVILDAKTGGLVESLTGLEGTVHGLAFSDGHLIASTSSGRLYDFGKAGSGREFRTPAPASIRSNEVAAATAREVVGKSGIRKGYCLDLGCGDGALTIALARQTELHIVAVERDEAIFLKTRAVLERAGLLGVRVTLLNRDPGQTGLPDSFANLVVSGRALLGGEMIEGREIARLRRPYGGILCSGSPGKIETSERGPLEGAGEWTHQYGDPANPLSSTDTLVRGELGMLWFRDVDIELSNRHGRGPSPLFADGRLFHAGSNEIIALDAYNGHELWRHEIPGLLSLLTGYGVTTTGSVFCLGDGILFARKGSKCHCIDTVTGELRNTLSVPGNSDSAWGYLAYSDGILYGSVANTDYVLATRYGPSPDHLTESREVFALEPGTGRVLWRHRAGHSIRHNAIAIDDRCVYLIDRPIDPADQRFAMTKQRLKKNAGNDADAVLMALDKNTGEVRWSNTTGIFGTTLSASSGHDSLVMAYQYTFLGLPSERRDRMAVFDSRSGKLRWDKPLPRGNLRSRPVVIGRTLYRDGEAWDLLTGVMNRFRFDRTYGCGHLSGAPNMLLFRSGTVGYFDLNAPEKGVQNYGGIRSGCFVNLIAAGGLVLAPDSTEECSCSYLNKCWMALQPKSTRDPE